MKKLSRDGVYCLSCIPEAILGLKQTQGQSWRKQTKLIKDLIISFMWHHCNHKFTLPNHQHQCNLCLELLCSKAVWLACPVPAGWRQAHHTNTQTHTTYSWFLSWKSWNYTCHAHTWCARSNYIIKLNFVSDCMPICIKCLKRIPIAVYFKCFVCTNTKDY